MSRKQLVVANWKMNSDAAFCRAWAQAFCAMPACDRETAVCVPSPYLGLMSSLIKDSPIALGAQDVNEFEKGAYTGEVSVPMLKDVGAEWVILGHSERRTYYGETDDRVAKKVQAALAGGLRPIVCVGETLAEREADRTEEVVVRQLKAVLDVVGAEALTRGAVAYEPVWAIGTGKSASAVEAQAVHSLLRMVVDSYSLLDAEKLRILYGGSVKPDNAPELFACDDIDGGLIGGAALDAQSFHKICAAQARTIL